MSPTEPDLPRGELPQPMLDRREVISRLKKAGIDPKTALEAILQEASYLAEVRSDDIHHGAAPTEAAEIAVIEHLTKFGVEVHNPKKLQKTLDDMSALLDDLGPND